MMDLTALFERLGDVALVRWTPALREIEASAPSVVVELVGRGRVRARVLRERTHVLRLEPGTGPHAIEKFSLTLLSVLGESEPRWVATERIVMRGA